MENNQDHSGMHEGEAERISDVITRKLEYWKEATVNIAVVGRSGSGKSSFINTIRGLTADDEDLDAAKVGCTQTTMKEKSYAFPGNLKLRLRDLPGMGTEEFPRETYLEIFDKDHNDCFVIICNSRFSDDEVWLANQIAAMGKKFYFVRSHIDDDIKNEKYDSRDRITEKEVLTKIKSKIEDNLPEISKCVDIYLIDGLDATIYDFPKLQKDIVDNFPSHKQEAMIRSIKATGELIKKKAQLFRKDIFYLSMKSAIKFAVLPSNSDKLKENEELLFSTAERYVSELGLDESAKESLRKCGPVNLQSFSEVLRQADQATYPSGLGIIAHTFVHFTPSIGKFFQRIRCGNVAFRYNSELLEDTLASIEEASQNDLEGVLNKLEEELIRNEVESQAIVDKDPARAEEPYFS